jgi:hypothetical protein
LGCGAERGLERLEPLQLHAQAGVERELVPVVDDRRRRLAAVVEEGGVDGGGGPDREVGAAAEAPVVRQEWRDQRQAQALSCARASRERERIRSDRELE